MLCGAGFAPIELGVEEAQRIGKYRASFKDMNDHLREVQSCLLLCTIDGSESMAQLFTRNRGVYILYVDLYDKEDIDVPYDQLGDDSNIPHYITYNAGTRLLQLYPTVPCLAYPC